MKRIGVVLFAVVAACVIVAMTVTVGHADGEASPIFGVKIPDGYRQWEMIAPAQNDAPLDDLHVTLGNSVAVKAYREGKLPFPDGSILAKLAWKRAQSPDSEGTHVPGEATAVQFMVKDSKKYAATGGWGFGYFVKGKPADAAKHQTCFECHEPLAGKNRDYVFTKYEP